MQHRIESWSGAHGMVETGKNVDRNEDGTRTGLDAGDARTNADGVDSVHHKYTVPSDKQNVFYTFTPAKGYTAETITIDNTTIDIEAVFGKKPNPGDTVILANTDGAGELAYIGGGQFKYEFKDPITKDHTVTATWKKDYVDLLVKKNWNDNNNELGLRPSTMPTVKLTDNNGGTYTDADVQNIDGTNEVVLQDGTSTSAYTWEELPVFKYDANGIAGDAIQYKLEENSDPVSGDYMPAVYLPNGENSGFTLEDGNQPNGEREWSTDPYVATIVNTPYKEIHITKTWDDQNNITGKRPTDPTATIGNFTLYQDAASSGAVVGDAPTISRSGNVDTLVWRVPAFDSDGNTIRYYAVETTVPQEYAITAGENGVEAKLTTQTAENITNTVQSINVVVYKKWNDGLDHSKRPTSSTDIANFGKNYFTLYQQKGASGTPSAYTAVEPTTIIADTDHDMFVITWTGVPSKVDGEDARYTVKETAVPANYSREASDADFVSDGGTITNTLLKDVEFTKTWADEGYENERPAADGTAGNYTLYNDTAMATPITQVTINGADTAVSATVTRSGSVDTIKYTNLPAYDANGDEIDYYIKETTTPSGYVVTEGKAGVAEGGNITNTVNKQSIEVTKVWDDADLLAENADVPAGGSTYERKDVTFNLTASYDSTSVDESKTIATSESDTADSQTDGTYKVDDNTFVAVFKDLPRFDSNDAEITYTVKESAIGGTSPEGTGGVAWTISGGTLTEKADGSGKETTITNTPVVDDTYNPITLTVSKTDKNTNTGLANATFTVYTDASATAKATATGDDAQVSANEVTTNASGTTTITFKKSGTYYLKETTAPTGYAAESGVLEFDVDTELQSINLKSADAEHTQAWWERLYDLIFGKTPAATDTVSYSDGNKTLTVKDEPITANILVRKTWNDNNNQDNLRDTAANATVTLEKSTDNGATWGAVSATAAPARTIPATDGSVIVNDEDHYTWENLPAYESGKLVLYRVKETGTLITGDALTGYAYTAKTASDSKEEFPIASVSGTTATAMSRTVNVQNTHTPRTIQIKVIKTWSDDSTAKRTTADVKLYKTVNRVETLVDTKTDVVPLADGDAVTFKDLPAYENGQAITYRVEESDVSGYKTSYTTTYTDASGTSQDNATGSVDATDIQRTYDGSGTTKVETTSATVAITNTELTDVEVEKTWIDGANANVTFELWRTAKPEADLTTSAFKNETITLDDGKKVTVQTWEPGTADGWAKVAEHDFSASEFAASSEGSTQTYTFKDLDKKDANGNKYLYRVLETTDGTSLTKDQKGNLAVTNTNTNPSSGLAYANVVKELQGRNWNDDDGFWFWLAPIKGVDSSGKPIEFSPSELSSGRNSGAPYPLLNHAYNIRDIPMPEGSTLYNDSHGALFVDAKAKATVNTTQVGAIGHVVSFSPIAFTEQDVGTWYYLISESLDEADDEWPEPNKSYDGITYALNDDGTKCKESVLKVVVSNDNGKITTELYWDGSDQQSAVPVFTNTYEATAEISPYVVKKVDGRDYKSGDSFQIDMVNLAGSPMRETKAAEGTTEPSTKIAATITNSDGSSVYVSASGSNYQDSGATSGDIKAAQSSVHTWIKTSDLTLPAEGKATGVFVYELSENPASEAADDDLIFDTNKLYMKVAVTDNEDGTLNTTTTYWLDAACTKAAPATQVLVYKKGDNKGKLAPANADPADTTNYEYVPAAYFENTKTADVTVKKQWVIKDGETEKPIEPIDNATVQLYRYKVESLDNLDSLPTDIDVWEPVSTHTFDRGDFYTATIKGETYTQTQAAAAVSRGDLLPEDVSGASWTYDSATLPTYVFEDLPLYTTNADGAQLQYVYRALEVSGSEAYDVTYSTDGSTWTKNWTDTGNLRDGELTIKNTVTATNTANVAAVKQLLGRNWATSDDFPFTLKPTGKATYGDDGEINGTDTSPATLAKIPVPKTDEDKDSSTSGQVATTHAKQDTDTYPAVDPNGGLERLARFGAITYTVDDLVYDEKDGHMQGDFFYEMRETIPVGAQAYNKTSGEKVDGVTYSDSTSDADRKAYAWKQNGITYDGDVHTVHVKVRENKTSELVVQVAYDETTKGDISTGTQFTPVYTNKYDAEGTAEANIYKYVMGRSWKSGDSFTFSAQPLGGAPFVNAETGEAITSDYTKTITVSDTSQTRQAVALDALKFTLDNLPWTVGVAGAKDASDPYSTGAITYSDGTTPAEGTKYGIFMYAVAETVSSPDDLDKDEDTEYIQVIVIDKGDGTLDTKVQYCEDRLGQTIRKEAQTTAPYSDSSTDATGATFVNQLKRDINVTKAWADPATSDVVLKLQWSTVGGTSDADWNDADGTSWLADFAATKTIDQDAEGDELTVTWKGLPAYANLTNDDIDLNDEWIYYRVVEEPINNVDTRYSETAYANGDKKTDSKYRTAPYTTEAAGQDIVKDFYVTNFPKDLESETTFGVVKQFIGKVWESESFTFEVTPLKSKRGSEESYTDYNADTNPMPKFKAADESTSATATATANTATAAVSVNEHAANFDPLLIKLSDLAVNDDGVAYGEFEYKIKEVIPAGATKITEGSKTYYVVEDAQGNLIKYTGEEHTVKIKATNNGQDTIDTEVSFDGRNVGEFVPVYTNYAMMATPIEGTKTWVGGENADHVNGTLTLADNEITAATDSLGLVLQRASAKDNVKQDVATDDAGRQLKIVWVKETKTTEGDTTTITRTSQVGGDGSGPYTYTVKALDSNNNYVNPILSISDSEGYTYTYSIKEGTVPTNYAVSYDGMDVTNTYDVKDALYVSKIWNDAENAAGLRPNSVTMHLFKEVTITEQGGTSTTELVQVDVPEQEIVKGESSETSGIHWSGLPVYDASGNKIKYVVVEESVAGYTTEYQVDFTTDGNWKPEADDAVKVELNGTSTVQRVYVRNSMVPETNKVKVTKVWDDNSDAAKKRPANVEFILKAYEWNTTLNDGAGGYPSTPAEVTTRPATKADVDADVAEKEAAGEESTMKLGDSITVTHLALDGAADSPTNQVANETEPTDANTWNGEWINLPTTKNGKPVYYVVEEVTTNTSVYGTGANKYSSTPCITGDQLSGYTVKNVFTPETAAVTITKTWEDNSNKDGLRPTTADYKSWLKLYRTTQAAIDAGDNPVEVTSDYLSSLAVTDNGNNTFTATWNNLPAVDNNGNTYIYSSAEVLPANSYYQATTGEGDSAATEAAGQPEAKEIAIQNNAITNKQMLQDVVVRKVWNDKIADLGTGEDIVKATRPTSITVKLTGDDGDAAADPAVAATEKTATLNAEGTYTEGSYADDYFTYTFTQVPIYKSDGATKITYTVSEDAVAGYKTSYVDVPATSNVEKDIIVNTYKVTKLEGTKQWIDGNKPHNNASEVVLTVNWKRNGDGSPAATDTGTVANPTIVWGTTEATKNNFSVVGLPAADANGNTFTYWVSEAEVAGYTTTYTGENKTHSTTTEVDGQPVTTTDGILDGGEIVNALKTGDVTITKKFVDSDGSTIPVDALPADYKIAVTYKTIEYNETTRKNEVVTKEVDLELKADTADPRRYTYSYVDGMHTWTIDGVASGTQVTAEEYNYTNLKGYSYKETATTVTADVWETHSDTNPTYAALIMPQKAANTAPTITLMSSSSGGGEPTATEAKIAYINKYTRDYGNLEPQKVWNDDLDRDGKRPDSLTFTLYATDGGSTTDTFNVFDGEGGAKTDHIELSLTKAKNDEGGAKASWYYYDDLDDTFISVPTHTEDGKLITYRLVEDTTDLPEGYSANPANGVVADTAAKGATKEMKITNTYEPKLDSLSATKVWDDADNSRGLRPDDSKVTLHLYKVVTEGEEGSQTTRLVQIEDEAKVVDSTNAMATWTNLPVYQNGTKIKYVVLEESVAGYTATYQVPGGSYVAPGDAPATNTALQVELDGNTTGAVQNVNIKNTLGEATSTVAVTKVWDDGNNVDGKRPDAGATFKLYKRVWDKQAQAYGAETQVTTRPAVQADVTAGIATQAGDTITLPNGGALTLTGTAATANTVAYELAPADANTWKGQWLNLPTQENGQTVIYYVKEDPNPVSTGYETAVITGNQLDGFTATNKHVPLVGEVLVDKVWDDDNNAAGARTGTMPKVELWYTTDNPISDESTWKKYDAATAQSVPVEGGKITASTNDKTYTWNNLPAYMRVQTSEEDVTPVVYESKKVTYKVVEDGKIASYEAPTYSAESFQLVEADGETARNQEVTVTNTYNKTEVEVTKIWIDATGNSVRPDADAYKSNLKLYADGTEVTDVPANKFTVTASGNTYTAKWIDLPKYKTSGTTRTEIVYTVLEVTDQTKTASSAVEGYAAPVYSNVDNPATDADEAAEKGKAYNGGTITNTQLISVDVTKTWSDTNNHDGKRDSIKVTLYQNGVELPAALGTAEQTLTEASANTETTNVWKWTNVWTVLPYADANGSVYNYTATETGVPTGYEVSDSKSIRQILLNAWKDAKKDTLVFSVTNTDTPDTISFTVDKIWDDANNVDKLRPDTIFYKLYQQIGDGDPTQVTSLPDGSSIHLPGGDNTEIDNGHIIVPVNKDDKTQGTPNTITITGLPKYERVKTSEEGVTPETYASKEITYTIVEEAVRGYNLDSAGVAQDMKATGSQTAGFTVANVHNPVSVTFTPELTKAISGRSFEADDSFTFTLEATGANKDDAPTPTPDWVTISPSSGTTATITFPPITFTGADMADKLNTGDTKTFTYKVKEVNGTKTIDDLTYDGAEKTVTVTLTRNENGTISATYAWAGEDGVKNTFTNTYGGVTNLTIRKVWVDVDADGTVLTVRPTSINVVVKATATVETPALVQAGFSLDTDESTDESKVYTKTITLTKADDELNASTWQKATGSLPKIDAAEETIAYDVVEAKLPNYAEPVYVNLGNLRTIVNTYERTTFTGTKVWVDGGKTHDNVTELDGKLTVQRTTAEQPQDGDWVEVADSNIHIHWAAATSTNPYTQAFTITGLPKYDTATGVEYTYRVLEGSVGGDYATTYTDASDAAKDAIYDNGKVTNKLVGTVTITGTKTWANDPEGTEHNNASEVKLTLKRQVAGGEETTVYTDGGTNKDDADKTLVPVWSDDTYTFKAENPDYPASSDEQYIDATLDKYDASGKEYTYTVTEAAIEGYATTYEDADTLLNGKITNTYGAASSSPTDASVVVNKIYTDNGEPMVYGTGSDKKILNAKKGDIFNFTLTGLAAGTYGAGTSTKNAAALSSGSGSCVDTVEGTTAAEGVQISKISFTELGTYAFQLAETEEEQKGVTYDKTTYVLIATVADDEPGDDEWNVSWKVVAKKSATDADWQQVTGDDQKKAEFNNSYTNLKTETAMKLTKELVGHRLDSTYKFDFVLFGGPVDNASTGIDTEKKITATTGTDIVNMTDGKATEIVEFADKLVYTLDDLKQLDGTYADERVFEYAVYETVGEADGVVYDTAPRYVKTKLTYVAKTDTAEEGLKVQWSVDDGATWKDALADNDLKFTNKYDTATTTSAPYSVVKAIDDKDNKDRTPAANEFLFKLTGTSEGTQDASSIEMLATNGADGKANFNAIPFSKAGTYVFKVAELAGQDGTIATYDTTERTLTATVTYVEAVAEDDPDTDYDETVDHFEVSWSGTGTGVDNDAGTITFTNETKQTTTDKPVRVTWVNDTDYDDTVGDQTTPESTAKDRPTSVTVTLRQEVIEKYTYNGTDYTSLDALKTAMGAGTTLQNVKDAIAAGTVTVTKKTVDAEDPADPGSSWSATLTKAANAKEGDPDNWFSDSFKNLPKYNELGEEITYTVAQTGIASSAGNKSGTKTDGLTSSVAPNGYTTAQVSINVGGVTTTLLNTYEAITITGTKVWVDGDQVHNNSEELADAFTVQRKAPSDAENAWVTLEKDKDYRIDWTKTNKADDTFKILGLAKYVDADADTKIEYQYKITETAPAHYTATYKNEDGEDATYLTAKGGTVTNTAETVDIYAKKVWANDSGDKSKRAAITFQLTQTNGDTSTKVGAAKPATETSATYEPITDAENSNCVVWKGLPKYVGSTNTEYVYTVDEVAVPAGYGQTKSGGGKSADDPIVITNTLGADVTAVTVAKVWEDNNNHDGARPVNDEVIVALSATSAADNTWDGKDTAGADVKTVTLNKSNNGVVRIENLPAADATGSPYTYTVKEMQVPNGYTDTYKSTVDGQEKTDGTVGSDGKVTITNTYTDNMITVKATKRWTDEPDGIGESLRTDVTLHLYGMNDNKIVYDAGTDTIKKDGSKTEASWNVPSRHYSDTAMTWKVVEEPVFGYTAMYYQETDAAGNVSFVVTNAYTGPVADIKVTKKWEDNSNEANMRPEIIYYQLWKKVGDASATKEGDPVAAIATNNYAYSWSDLPTVYKTEDTSTKIEQEEYTEPVTSDTVVTDTVVYKFEKDGVTYYNASENGTGTWYDEDGVEVDISATDLTDATAVTETKTRDKETTETTTQEEPILYSVTEVTDKAPEGGNSLDSLGYEGVMTATDKPGEFEAINTLGRQTVKAEITKIWADNGNAANNRPDHIRVTLTGSDGKTYSAIITGDATANEWKYTFTDLPKYKEGEVGIEVAYTVDEDQVDGYGKLVNGFTITNTNNGTKMLRVEKSWVDNQGNPLDAAPASATFNLVKTIQGYGPQVVEGQEKTISAGDAVNSDGVNVLTWENLPAMQDGKPIEYSVEEQPIEGYSTSVGTGETVDNVTTIKVTNTQNPEPDPEPVPQKLVTYIDPLNGEGQMVMKSTSYDGTDADAHASAKDDKPTDPSHSGYTFMGWYTGGTDEAGNYIIVAKYNVTAPPSYQRTVSYIDAQSGKLLVSELSEDENSVTPPADPTAEGMTFAGWERFEDENGNVVFAAKWASDCANPAPQPTPVPTVTPKTTPVPTGTSASGAPVKGTPKTSDEAPVAPLATVAVAGLAAMVLSRGQMRAVPAAAGRHVAGKHVRASAMEDALNLRR